MDRFSRLAVRDRQAVIPGQVVVNALEKLQAQRQPQRFRRHRLACQRIGDPLAGGCQRLCQRAVKPPGDAHRQHEAMDQAGA